MAVVQQPLIARQRDVFKSVFPAGIARPPRNRQQFDSGTDHNIDLLRQLLTQDSRTALGIGDADFRYGPADINNSNIPVFCTYFPESSTTVEGFSKPSNHDTAQLLKRFERFSTWRQRLPWTKDLGVSRLKTIFAGIIDRVLTDFVEWSYSRSYGVGVLEHLDFWVKHILIPYTTHFFTSIDPDHVTKEPTEAEMEMWRQMAITRLATLRVNELFEMIIEWPDSAPGIDDLKHYTTNPATRSYVTSNFVTVIGTRLLHPGASTIEILQVYISIIRAFRRLDPKGVLLERVSRKIRRYLRERDDTIKIVVAGLLSDFELQEDSQTIIPNPDILTELAYELQQRDSGEDERNGGGNGLDWNNMDWVPDPIDAAPDYMRSMNTDVVGSVISLFESKDVFVHELQTALAERLLRNKTDYDQEISVVEHLKIRFGDSALQACEVMLRDVLDSRKLDQVIRQDQGLDPKSTETTSSTNLDNEDDNDRYEQTELSLHAKILSRLFWPSLPEQPFRVPLAVLEQRNRYEKGFESLKQTRKLTWNDTLGHVQVELALVDRTIVLDDVTPYQVTVIYAFQEAEDDGTAPAQDGDGVIRTVAELAAELSMSTALVRSACMFWASKRVLRQVGGRADTFAVLETLPPTTSDNDTETTTTTTSTLRNPAAAAAGQPIPSPTQNAASASAAAAAAEADAAAAAAEAIKEAEAAERKQKLAVYQQFVVSMLTNQGAMPLPRIAMMLGLVVPGGFPFSNEELREFLTQMVRDAVLEVGPGGNYKVAT